MTDQRSPTEFWSLLRKHWQWGVLLLVSLAALGVIFVVPYIPGHDGPHHIYLAHLENHYGDPDAPYKHFYEPGVAVTALGFVFFYAPLEELLGWRMAYQVYLAGLVLLWGWSTVALLRAISPRRMILGVLGFVLGFQWALYMGFYSFMSGTAIGLLVLALALQRYPWSVPRRLAIAGALLVEAFAHVFTAEATALVLIVLVLVFSPRGKRLLELGKLAVMGIPTMAVAVAAAAWIEDTHQPLLSTDAALPSITFLQKLQLVVHGFVGGPWWRGWPVVLGALAAAGIGIYRASKGKLDAHSKVMLAGGVLLMALFVALPLHLATWQFLAPRFLPMGITLLLAILPVESLAKRMRWVAGAALALYTMGALGWSAKFHEKLWNQVRTAIEGTEQNFGRYQVLFPILFDWTAAGENTWTNGPYWFYQPLRAIGDLYATTQDAVVPYTFTVVRQLHGFTLRDNLSKLFPPHPNFASFAKAYNQALAANDHHKILQLLTLLAIYGSRFDGVILQETTNEHEVFLNRGYEVKWHRGKTWLLKYRGCPVRVRVEGVASEARRGVRAWYAWSPETTWLPGGAPVASGTNTVVVPLDEAPCGLVRMKIRGAPKSDPHRTVGCASNHPRSSSFLVKLTPKITKIVCTLRGEEAPPSPRSNASGNKKPL